jgi:hypothetical protein
MNVTFHWFGIVWFGATLIGVLASAVVVGVAIGPVRRVSARASTLAVVAATLAGELGLRLLDAWTIARPVLEGVAIAMLGGAMWVLAKVR